MWESHLNTLCSSSTSSQRTRVPFTSREISSGMTRLATLSTA